MSRPAVPAAIERGRVIAILRRLERDLLEGVADVLVDSGIHALEVTLDSDDAIEAVAMLAKRYRTSDVIVGAGTILDLESAQAASDAGARFLASPHTDLSIVRWAAERELPMFPGAFTPTEIVPAWRAGAAAVKLFPAEVGGLAHVRALRGPLRHIPLIPTGGITDTTAPQFLSLGALAVGAGSWLTGDGEPDGVAKRAQALVAAIEQVTQLAARQ